MAYLAETQKHFRPGNLQPSYISRHWGLSQSNGNRLEVGAGTTSVYIREKIWVCQEVSWHPYRVELEKEDRYLQIISYRVGVETGELQMENRKEHKNHLPNSHSGMTSRFLGTECLQVLVAETKE